MNEYDIKRLDKVRKFYTENGILPTYTEMKPLLGVSRTACFNFVQRMIKFNRIKKVGIRIGPGELFMQNDAERFKDILGYEGLYEVSNSGRVKSKLNQSFRMLVRKLDRNGYLRVGLRKDNKPKSFLVHRLVALTFIPNPESKPHVNHINGVKTDNREENLEWCTREENMKHAVENDLWGHKKRKKDLTSVNP